MKLAPTIAALLLALHSGSAHAQDAKTEARAAYTRGEKLAEAGKLREAALAFAEADRLAPTEVALDSAIGAAARTGDPVLVMTLVERAEATQRATFPAVVDARARFAGRVGRLTLPCRDEKPACTAKLDGSPVETSTVLVLVGSHEITLELGTRKRNEQLVIKSGEERRVELPADKVALPVAAPVEPSSGISPWWLTIGGALTLGFGGAALGTGLASIAAEDELTELQAAGASVGEQQEVIDRGEQHALLSNVFIGVSAAAATATLFVGIFAVDWSGGAPAKVAFVPLPGGGYLGVEASF
jgi:hypothetical protein